MLFIAIYPERKHDVYCLGRYILNFFKSTLFKETPNETDAQTLQSRDSLILWSKRNPLMNLLPKAIRSEKSTLTRKKKKKEEKVWSCVLIPVGMKMFHHDVLLSGQQQNHGITAPNPVNWMIPNIILRHENTLSKGRNECRFSSWSWKMLQMTLRRICHLFIIYCQIQYWTSA